MYVTGCGAVTSVGLTAAQTAMAFHAGLSGIRECMPLMPLERGVLGGRVPSAQELRQDPHEWILHLAARALRECLEGVPSDVRVALFVGVAEPWRKHPAWTQRDPAALIGELERRLNRRFHASSAVRADGGASALCLLRDARRQLAEGNVEVCVVGGVDSLINLSDVRRLALAQRVAPHQTSQGVVPGEGAAFVRLEAHAGPDVRAFATIRGVGDSKEPHPVKEDRASSGRGLEEAMRRALEDSGIEESKIGLRVATLNGERYAAMEHLLTTPRFYRTRREHLPAWYPASSVGDTGAASGALALVLASWGMAFGSAPAPVAMCEAASEAGTRAACLMTSCRGGPEPPFRLDSPERESALPAPLERRSAVIPEMPSMAAENAAFLWAQRERLADSPSPLLRDLRGWDERIEAQLGVLRTASEHFATIAESFAAEDGERCFVRATVALLTGDARRWDEVLDSAVGVAEAERSIIAALEWCDDARTARFIEQLLADPRHERAALGAAAAVAQGRDPGGRLDALLQADAPAVLARVLWCVGQLGKRSQKEAVERLMTHGEADVRLAAAAAGCLLGVPAAPERLADIALEPGVDTEWCTDLAFRALPRDAAHRRWTALGSDRRRVAAIAAGAIGSTRNAPWLLECMAEPKHARIAFEAFRVITGASADADDLSTGPPDDEPVPSEHPEDEDVSMDRDGDRPWPNVPAIQKWWQAHRSELRDEARRLGGRPIAPQTLGAVLSDGAQALRRAAAWEIPLQAPGTPVFPFRGPAWRQVRALSERRS